MLTNLEIADIRAQHGWRLRIVHLRKTSNEMQTNHVSKTDKMPAHVPSSPHPCVMSPDRVKEVEMKNVKKKPTLYKTELCRSFEETGSCRYGNKCQFAHGEPEKRTIQRHPKVRLLLDYIRNINDNSTNQNAAKRFGRRDRVRTASAAALYTTTRSCRPR